MPYDDKKGMLISTHLRNQSLILFEDPQGHDKSEAKSMMPDLFRAAGQLQAQRFG